MRRRRGRGKHGHHLPVRGPLRRQEARLGQEQLARPGLAKTCVSGRMGQVVQRWSRYSASVSGSGVLLKPGKDSCGRLKEGWQLGMDDIPDKAVLHLGIPMDQDVAESNDAPVIRELAGYLRRRPCQSGHRLADYLELALHC